jgi:hypothetical protein
MAPQKIAEKKEMMIQSKTLRMPDNSLNMYILM